MTSLPEVTDLFSRLALRLQTLNHVEDDDEEESINLSISKLNQSLNICEDSRVRVLETALSLMCFEAPKVDEASLDDSETLVKTIASILTASINCEMLRFGNEEVLRIGSSIPRLGCEELIKACIDVIEKLKGHGLSHLLLLAVLRVTVSASHYQLSLPYTIFLDRKSVDGGASDLSVLFSYLPSQFVLDNQEVPLRLVFWYLDPLTLKHDISKILQDCLKRPFLCLSKEFHERVDWHAVVICLALCPTMFIETRALLHDWFLLTGLASILELLIGLVSVILEINVTPTLWGISLELGSKLPFPGSYFPYNNYLLRTLAGPLTSEGFLHLVHGTSKPVFHDRKQFNPPVNQSMTKVVATDHKSFWALAISFPGWLLFASMLLFCEKSFQESFHLKYSLGVPKIEQLQDMELLSTAAARYMAWILSPINKSKQELLADCLKQISESWTVKQFSQGNNHKEESWYEKKLKKPKFHGNKGGCTVDKEYDCQMIKLWLEEFQSLSMKFSTKIVNNSESLETKSSHGLNLHQTVFFRRIPLGILVGFPNHMTEEGCELLLHYAATGRILQFRETKSSGLKHGNSKSLSKEDSIMWPVNFSKREAVSGACIIFSLTDNVESMSSSLWETEESAVDFINQVKLRTGKYLIKCIKRLIQLNIDEDGVQMVMDLSSRLMRWRHQGQEVVQLDKDLTDVINVLCKKSSSI